MIERQKEKRVDKLTPCTLKGIYEKRPLKGRLRKFSNGLRYIELYITPFFEPRDLPKLKYSSINFKVPAADLPSIFNHARRESRGKPAFRAADRRLSSCLLSQNLEGSSGWHSYSGYTVVGLQSTVTQP